MARGGKLIWKRTIPKRIINAGQKGLIHGATVLYSYSQEHVPLDDGELSLGARVTSDGVGSNEMSVAVSYGNNPVSAQYAVIQHENLAYSHKPGENAKFLENAFTEIAPEIPKIIADYIRGVL